MERIQIRVADHGAELRGLAKDGKEYMWNADPVFWGRVAPMLFPIVGKVADETLRVDGREYEMHQHGFARDVDFVKEGEVWVYRQAEPRANYPYPFRLEARYIVHEQFVTCSWTVINNGDGPMHFQIGAHPAFLMPDYHAEDPVHGYLKCFGPDGKSIKPMASSYLEGGLRIKTEPREVPNEDGLIVLTGETFAADAFLLEGSKVAAVALLDKDGKEVLRVHCPKAEAFGLWAPHKPGCPFVCIEPCSGIADTVGFQGDISERDYDHRLEPGESFEFCFDIVIAS